jgi:hypothetical protein
MPKERTDRTQASVDETPPAHRPIPTVALVVRLITSLVDEASLDTSHLSPEQLAEMMARLVLLASPWQCATMQGSMSDRQTASFFLAQEGAAVGTMPLIKPGQSLPLDAGVYAHKCGKCLQIWISEQADPVKCPRQAADKRGPKCGTRRWREVWTMHEQSDDQTHSDAVMQTTDGQPIEIECTSSTLADSPSITRQPARV